MFRSPDPGKVSDDFESIRLCLVFLVKVAQVTNDLPDFVGQYQSLLSGLGAHECL